MSKTIMLIRVVMVKAVLATILTKKIICFGNW
jgi:hypothetical protein